MFLTNSISIQARESSDMWIFQSSNLQPLTSQRALDYRFTNLSAGARLFVACFWTTSSLVEAGQSDPNYQHHNWKNATKDKFSYRCFCRLSFSCVTLFQRNGMSARTLRSRRWFGWRSGRSMRDLVWYRWTARVSLPTLPSLDVSAFGWTVIFSVPTTRATLEAVVN